MPKGQMLFHQLPHRVERLVQLRAELLVAHDAGDDAATRAATDDFGHELLDVTERGGI